MFEALPSLLALGIHRQHRRTLLVSCGSPLLPGPFRTTAAGVPGRNGYQQSSTPAHLVRELATKFKRRGIQNRTVQSRLRLDVLASRLAQVLYLQALHYDNRVVFAEAVGGLVYEILSDIGDALMQPADPGLRFLPVIREFLLASQPPLQLRQLPGVLWAARYARCCCRLRILAGYERNPCGPSCGSPESRLAS